MISLCQAYITSDLFKCRCTIEELNVSIDPSVNDIQLESEKLVCFEAICHGDHRDDAHYLLEILQDGEIRGVCVLRVSKEVEHQVDSLVIDLIDLLALFKVAKVSLLLDLLHCLLIVHQLHPKTVKNLQYPLYKSLCVFARNPSPWSPRSQQCL
jgi:hypothetical protein